MIQKKGLEGMPLSEEDEGPVGDATAEKKKGLDGMTQTLKKSLGETPLTQKDQEVDNYTR